MLTYSLGSDFEKKLLVWSQAELAEAGRRQAIMAAVIGELRIRMRPQFRQAPFNCDYGIVEADRQLIHRQAIGRHAEKKRELEAACPTNL